MLSKWLYFYVLQAILMPARRVKSKADSLGFMYQIKKSISKIFHRKKREVSGSFTMLLKAIKKYIT